MWRCHGGIGGSRRKSETYCLEIVSVKKEANLSGRDMDEEEVGYDDIDLRWNSLLTVCQRQRGLVEDEETRLE